MFEKNLKLAYLLDFYGDVLDEHTRSAMKAYYDDDLSLSEIAAGVGISRQGVRHLIKKGEEQLSFLEDRLGLAERHERLGDASALIGDAISSLKDGKQSAEEITALLAEAQDIIINR